MSQSTDNGSESGYNSDDYILSIATTGNPPRSESGSETDSPPGSPIKKHRIEQPDASVSQEEDDFLKSLEALEAFVAPPPADPLLCSSGIRVVAHYGHGSFASTRCIDGITQLLQSLNLPADLLTTSVESILQSVNYHHLLEGRGMHSTASIVGTYACGRNFRSKDISAQAIRESIDETFQTDDCTYSNFIRKIKKNMRGTFDKAFSDPFSTYKHDVGYAYALGKTFVLVDVTRMLNKTLENTQNRLSITHGFSQIYSICRKSPNDPEYDARLRAQELYYEEMNAMITRDTSNPRVLLDIAENMFTTNELPRVSEIARYFLADQQVTIQLDQQLAGRKLTLGKDTSSRRNVTTFVFGLFLVSPDHMAPVLVCDILMPVSINKRTITALPMDIIMQLFNSTFVGFIGIFYLYQSYKDVDPNLIRHEKLKSALDAFAKADDNNYATALNFSLIMMTPYFEWLKEIGFTKSTQEIKSDIRQHYANHLVQIRALYPKPKLPQGGGVNPRDWWIGLFENNDNCKVLLTEHMHDMFKLPVHQLKPELVKLSIIQFFSVSGSLMQSDLVVCELLLSKITGVPSTVIDASCGNREDETDTSTHLSGHEIFTPLSQQLTQESVASVISSHNYDDALEWLLQYAELSQDGSQLSVDSSSSSSSSSASGGRCVSECFDPIVEVDSSEMQGLDSSAIKYFSKEELSLLFGSSSPQMSDSLPSQLSPVPSASDLSSEEDSMHGGEVSKIRVPESLANKIRAIKCFVIEQNGPQSTLEDETRETNEWFKDRNRTKEENKGDKSNGDKSNGGKSNGGKSTRRVKRKSIKQKQPRIKVFYNKKTKKTLVQSARKSRRSKISK
jgi:hypothetical protein